MPDHPPPSKPAPKGSPSTAEDMKVHMAKGSVWMVSMRWTIRFIGLLSTVILARLLAPEDFGLFTIAMLIIGFSELVGKAGQELAIIRHPNPTREHMDSAWTASIFVGFGLGALVMASAPLIAWAFDEPRAELLIYILSIRVFVLGFENIGVVMFRRNLNFAKEFKYGLAQKFFKVGITISLAFILRNYWALVIGSIAGHIIFIAFSYIAHAYRPKICFKKIREIWSFSAWILFSLMGEFFQTRIDRFLIGAFNSTSSMGFYQIGADLGRMPTYELAQPVARALIPSYAKLIHDREELKSAYLDAFSIMAIICFSVATGFALIADDFVHIVYGEKWDNAVAVVTWIALQAGVASLTQTVNPVLTATGQSKRIALLNWMNVIPMLLALTYIALQTQEISAIAQMRMAVTTAIAPTFFVLLAKSIPISFWDIGRFIWRPMISALAMAGAVISLPDTIAYGWRPLSLIIDTFMGASVYILVQYSLWLAAQRPNGPEKMIAQHIGKKWRSLVA